MNAEVMVHTGGVEHLFREMEELSGKTGGQLLRESAGLLGKTLASYTQPVMGASGGAISGSEDASGLTKGAQNLGKAAVARDVGRVYVSPGVVAATIRVGHGNKQARRFGYLVKAGKFAEAEHLIRDLGIQGAALTVQAWDEGRRHRQMRNSRGRVSRGTKPVIVDDSDALKAYLREKQRLVGLAKSSWITAARMIQGAKGIGSVPAWIRKLNGPGVGIDRTRGETTSPHIILRSRLEYIDTAAREAVQDSGFRMFGFRLENQLLNAINALRRKAAARQWAEAA